MASFRRKTDSLSPRHSSLRGAAAPTASATSSILRFNRIDIESDRGEALTLEVCHGTLIRKLNSNRSEPWPWFAFGTNLTNFLRAIIESFPKDHGDDVEFFTFGSSLRECE